ncbi:cytochrome c family protein [Botrimarina hoheduenensis]|uniref:Perchlorate reductase subunit gamma n=1 Tax=Botrimarina hoheduenensis TaxID=2528000 RepID=A0A5C5VXT2_9BACT|nr:cytochrome c family protein [Botrimarina hoheduenensis]TWT43426.1 Perchlorate reductase subunit gamma precursor [Botrimarina hoheduenensis]
MNHLARQIVSGTASVLLVILYGIADGAAQAPPVTGGEAFDPARVRGADSCLKCHTAEVDRWRSTPHAMTIDTLHRKPEAKAIAERLGIRSVKRNDTCVRCHYTRQEVRGRVRIDSGVSCESCHGPSDRWIELHADYGPGATRESESPAHRQQRRQRSVEAGMNNPANLYLIARQCLDCHTTPNEELVDVGGHPAGSRDFSLVAWSQGQVRHNFVRSGGVLNEPSSPARLRVMHVVGVMTDLEYSLRAVATASRTGAFATTSAERAASKKQELWEIQRRLNEPLIQQALAPLATLQLKLDNSAAIILAAQTLSDATYAFAERADGARLAAIDNLLPSPETYK